MSPAEPAELQILRQTLGHDLGSMVFTLNMMAGTLAQQGQQLQEQAAQIEQMQQPAPAPEAAPATVNPFTGETVEVAEAT